jgi:UDP-3-O-[3-hydroxymyristoyl] glucosamine N-acyltransferase
MQLSLQQIAEKVGGMLKGNGAQMVSGAAGLAEATAHDISFVRDAKNVAAIKALPATQAAAVIVPENFEVAAPCSTIAVKSPIAAFSAVLGIIAAETRPAVAVGRHPMSFVDPSARVAPSAAIGPFCTVAQNATIEDGVVLVSNVYVGPRSVVKKDTILYPSVVLREDTLVGERCIIHPGTVLGSDGYGFFYENGKHNKIPQVGQVVIEDDVEIGGNCSIDRANTGRTVIKKGSKLDNLVHIAHNVEVGPHALLAGQVGVAGSTKIGAFVAFGGQVGVADHITIGDGAQAGAQTGIKNSVDPGAILFGTPAQPIQDTLKQHVLIRKLPELFKEFKQMKDKLESYVGR